VYQNTTLTLMSGQLHSRSKHPVNSGAFVSPIVGLDVAVKGETPCPCVKCLMNLGMWNIRYLHQTHVSYVRVTMPLYLSPPILLTPVTTMFIS